VLIPEEYRYDALGRRVMTRVRRPNGGAPTGTNPLCSSVVNGVCSSYYERTWWAGDQILAEWRTADGTPNPTNSGTVGYVHAPGVKGIDAPVAVITSAGTRVITEDWRGLGESSLFPNGAPADNTIYGGTAITVAWPSGKGAYFTPYLGQPSGSSVESTWLGSLVEHGAGSTGLLYRRNRYYDPQSGRFTQQDPIGLAGGVNLYGFAGGDPVSYSDPFGLCPGDKGGDSDTKTLADCPRGSEGWHQYRSGAAVATDGPLFLLFGGLEYRAVKGTALVAGKIAGFTKHGINQAISRDGVGVATEAIPDAVKNPVKVVRQARGAMKYVGENATVILDQSGEVVTTWARSSGGWRIRP